ncbi:MAG TPA: type II secretion system F family protein, partial [Terriglobales bacterium]|nr:type II secretion system F family protein [Terriglobales bacterium]
MAEFTIKMADERGRMLEQVESGFSANDIRDRLSQQGYLVYSIKPRGFAAGGFRFTQRKRVKLDQFVIFNSQFLTLIRAGLPIVQALELLLKRQKNSYFRSVLENVRERVKGGELLSDAFAAQGAFPKIYPTTLLAGEKSGNMEEVLSRYISFQRMAMTFRKKLQASLVYPALLSVMVTAMLIFLMTFVVPRFGELYRDISSEKQLPALTLFMLAVGENAQKYAPFAAVALAIAVVMFWQWKNSEKGSRTVDRVRLGTPLLGGIWLKYQIAILCRMLGTLLSGGLPLVPSLETAGSSMQSRAIADAIAEASHKVREGRP